MIKLLHHERTGGGGGERCINCDACAREQGSRAREVGFLIDDPIGQHTDISR